MEWDLKLFSNLIQTINDYYLENKHDLTRQIYSMLNVKSKYYWWKDINYIEKPVTKMLSQTINEFSNIWGIMTHC
jgi:hypothetical protein